MFLLTKPWVFSLLRRKVETVINGKQTSHIAVLLLQCCQSRYKEGRTDLKSSANKPFNHSNQTRGLPWLQEVKVLIPGYKKSTGGRLQVLLPPPEQFSQYFPFSGPFHLENIFFFPQFWKVNSFVNYYSKHEYFSNSRLSITIKMLLLLPNHFRKMQKRPQFLVNSVRRITEHNPGLSQWNKMD